MINKVSNDKYRLKQICKVLKDWKLKNIDNKMALIQIDSILEVEDKYLDKYRGVKHK